MNERDAPERAAEDTGASRPERQVHDATGRRTPYVEGPTGPAPIASELHGDPGAEGDRRGEGGALAGAVAGTAVAGPIGGVVGALAGGTLGTAQDEGPDAENPEIERAADREEQR